MNLRVEITGLKEFAAGLSELTQSKIPKALSIAMTKTANDARMDIQKKLDEVFKPGVTRFIKNSIQTEYEYTNHLAAASVYVRNTDKSEKGALTPAQILSPNIYGGGRATKRSEATLRGLGVMMNDQFIVPGPAAKRDQYGNVSGSEMIRILSAAGLLESGGGYKANQTEKSRKRRGGLKMQRAYVVPFVGIFWYIPGQKITPPILFFTNKPPHYKKMFPFRETFAESVRTKFLKNLLQAWGGEMLKQGAYGR